jgi:hypothetical protein
MLQILELNVYVEYIDCEASDTIVQINRREKKNMELIFPIFPPDVAFYF